MNMGYMRLSLDGIFTGTVYRKLAVKRPLTFPPHIKH